MLERAFMIRERLVKYFLLDTDMNLMTLKEFQGLEPLCRLLKEFNVASSMMSAEKFPTLETVIPMFNALWDYMEEMMEEDLENVCFSFFFLVLFLKFFNK